MSNDPLSRKPTSRSNHTLAALFRPSTGRPSPRKSSFLDNWLGTFKAALTTNSAQISKATSPSTPETTNSFFAKKPVSHASVAVAAVAGSTKIPSTTYQHTQENKIGSKSNMSVLQKNDPSITTNRNRILDGGDVVYDDSDGLHRDTVKATDIANNPQDGSFFEIIDMTLLSSGDSSSSDDDFKHAEGCRCNLCFGKKTIARKRQLGDNFLDKNSTGNVKRKLCNGKNIIDIENSEENRNVARAGKSDPRLHSTLTKNQHGIGKRKNRSRMDSSDSESSSSDDNSSAGSESSAIKIDFDSSDSETSSTDSSVDDNIRPYKHRAAKLACVTKLPPVLENGTPKTTPLSRSPSHKRKKNNSPSTTKVAPVTDVGLASAHSSVTTKNKGQKNPLKPIKPATGMKVVSMSKKKGESIANGSPKGQESESSDAVEAVRTRQENDKPEMCHGSDDDVIDVYKLGASPSGHYSLEAFKKMWESALQDMGTSLDEVEEGKWVKSANNKLDVNDSSNFQSGAQYGRLYFDPTHFLMKHTNVWDLKSNDVFIDIGSGVGNAVLQAAYTTGCEARGIELVASRNAIALSILHSMESLRDVHRNVHGNNVSVGAIEFREGKLEDPCNKKYLIKPPASYYDTDKDKRGATKVLVNNFNGVFAERSGNKDGPYLDDFVAGLFAMMVPGSIMVTLHRLTFPPDWNKVEEARGRHSLSVDHNNSSFYTYEEITVGVAKDTVSWAGSSNMAQIKGYVYKRRQQDSAEACFLCTNPDCQKARNATPIMATKSIPIEGGEGIIIRESCDSCGKIPKNLRPRKDVNYGDNTISCFY